MSGPLRDVGGCQRGPLTACLSEEGADRLRVGFGDRPGLTERPLQLRRLVLQIVALTGLPAQELPRCGHPELLLGSRVSLLFRHLSSLLRSWSAPAPSSCCGLRGAAGSRSSRAP